MALQRNQSGKKQSFRVVRLYLTHTRHVNRCTSSGLHSMARYASALKRDGYIETDLL